MSAALQRYKLLKVAGRHENLKPLRKGLSTRFTGQVCRAKGGSVVGIFVREAHHPARVVRLPTGETGEQFVRTHQWPEGVDHRYPVVD